MCASFYLMMLLRFSQVMQAVIPCTNTPHFLFLLIDEHLHCSPPLLAVINDTAVNIIVYVASPTPVRLHSRSRVAKYQDMDLFILSGQYQLLYQCMVCLLWASSESHYPHTSSPRFHSYIFL